MIDGLLHIGGMAVLAGTGYFGLEKVGPSEDFVAEHLKKLKKEINDELNRLDFDPMSPEDDVILSTFDNDEAHLLMEFAERSCNIYDRKPSHTYPSFKNKTTFGMDYLSKGRHKVCIGVLTVLSILSFFILVGCTVVFHEPEQPENFIQSVYYEWGGFFIFAITLLWIFVSVLIAHYVSAIRNRLLPMLERLKKQLEADESKIKNRLSKSMKATFERLGNSDQAPETLR